MNRVAIIAAALTLLPFHTTEAAERARYLMGTVCEIAAQDQTAAAANLDVAFREAERVEAMLSTWRDDSDLARLNRERSGVVSSELAMLLTTAMEWVQRSGGAFNPLVRPLIDLWRTRAEGSIPASDAIDAAVRRADPMNVAIRGTSVVLRNGATLEEGAFGKGYALDRMLAVLGPGEAMIDFGGQVAVRGSVRVTIADPQQRDHAVAALTLTDASIATSSGSEQTFVVAGRTFTHLIDPRTGQALPPRGSVSAIARYALSADILSTALYAMGPEEGFAWAEKNAVAAIFIDSENRIRRTAEAMRMTRGFEVVDEKYALKD